MYRMILWTSMYLDRYLVSEELVNLSIKFVEDVDLIRNTKINRKESLITFLKEAKKMWTECGL